MVTACGEEPDSVSSAGPDASVVDGTARWREVLNERVDTEQSAFDPQREYAQVLTDFEVVELNDVAAWSTVVVRGITGAVERVGASPAPTGLPVEQAIGDQNIRAVYSQSIEVLDVLGVTDGLDEAHEAALDSGEIERVFRGPNTANPAVLDYLTSNQLVIPLNGLGALPDGVEVVLYLRDSAVPGDEFRDVVLDESESTATDVFIDAAEPFSYFYSTEDGLVRPSLPLVEDVPGVELTDVNRASLRAAASEGIGDYVGAQNELVTPEQVSTSLEELGAALR